MYDLREYLRTYKVYVKKARIFSIVEELADVI